MNCRQSELQKGILFHCFPSRRSGNPITSFPGNFQSRAKCCQTEKESICLPSHVSMQCKSRGENSKNWRKNWSWFVCCIIFRATKWAEGGGRGGGCPSSGKTICPITYKLKMWNVSISVSGLGDCLAHKTKTTASELHFNFDCGSPAPL